MIGAVVLGFANLFPSLLIRDEDEKRAARAAIAVAVGAGLAAIDPTAPIAAGVYGGLMAAKEAGAAAIKDPNARAIFEASMDIGAEALTGNLLLGALKAGAGGVGAAVGASVAQVEGDDPHAGLARGLGLGASLASVDPGDLAAKAGGAAAGGVIARVSAEDRRDEAMWLGMEIGGSLGGMAPADADALERIMPAATEAVGVGLGVASHAVRGREDPGDLLASIRSGRALAAQMSLGLESARDLAAAEGSLATAVASADLVSAATRGAMAVVREKLVEERLRALARRAGAGDLGAEREHARLREQDRLQSFAEDVDDRGGALIRGAEQARQAARIAALELERRLSEGRSSDEGA